MARLRSGTRRLLERAQRTKDLRPSARTMVATRIKSERAKRPTKSHKKRLASQHLSGMF